MAKQNININIRDISISPEILATCERLLSESEHGHFRSFKRKLMQVQSAILITPSDFIDDEDRELFGEAVLSVYNLIDDLEGLIEDSKKAS